MWASGFPENATSGNCIHLSIPRKMNVTGLTIKNCGDTFIFSCKGPTTPPPKCFKPVCPDSSCIKKEALYVTAPDNITKYLDRPTQYGVWKSKNYRIFLFGNQSKTWNDAKETCCAIGMKLLSLDADYKYSTLSQVIAGKDNATLSAKYWTSGTDNGCPGAFGWCAENKLVRNALWAPGEPRAGNYCVVADVRTTNTTLMTADCTQSLRFICETRDTSNATSAGETIKDECAANFNVSIAEQDRIFNSTSFSRRIKCFLKCVGEAGGLMVNGRIVDGQLIKLAEILSQNDNEKLMENLKAVDECSNIRGMNECDMIASVFQCGQEKAPDLVANVIKTVELNDTAEKTPLKPKLGQCITDYECEVDPYWRNAFVTNNGNADGKVMDICGQRYLLGMNKASYREGSSWCCLYGLNLVSFQTKRELECVINSSLGGLQRPASIWTSASRKGTTDMEGFRWCTSRVFFNYTMWKWYPEIEKYPTGYLITFVAEDTFADTYFNVNADKPGVAYPFCEQRPV
ncbi:uncharacterized protein LOC135944810 [Cloeon dipterum]|uniref:uncharacterized protein LOC135944810 n=1 Tax=Cloeon dipterum TaxID=197152 RepID=UPI00322006A2